MDQPFSAMAKELFERQVYPAAATGATAAGAHLPYDITGWTLPLQMGVSVDAISDPMEPAQRALMTKIDQVKLPEAQVAGDGSIFVVSHKPNAAFQLVNAALAQGGSVSMASDTVKTSEGMEKGAFVISGLSHSAVCGTCDEVLRRRCVDSVYSRSCHSDQEGEDRPLPSVEPVDRRRMDAVDSRELQLRTQEHLQRRHTVWQVCAADTTSSSSRT